MLDRLCKIIKSLQNFRNLPNGASSVEFKISGMHCPSCSLNIDGNLEELTGVIEAKTSYAKGVTKIYYDPQKIQPEELKKCVIRTGYQLA